MSSGSRIAKNAAWLIMATTAQKFVAFISFILVARFIGKEQTGVFFYSISITSIFVTFADLGMTPVVVRALAGDREDGAHLLGAAIRAKLVLAPLAIIGAVVYALVFSPDVVTLATVTIACFVMTADTFNLVMYGALRGRQNLRPEAIGMFVGQFLTATASVVAAWFGFGPVGLAVALLLGSVWNVVWAGVQMKRFAIHLATPRRLDLKVLAREAVPFALAGFAVKVYSYVDSLFLNIYHGSAAVGLYAVAYKLTYALQFLPLTFVAALYPALASSFAKKEERELRDTFMGSLRLMAAVSFPLTAALSALAPRIIPLLYGKSFIDSVPVLVILPWVLIPIFLDFPVGSLLNATHRAQLKTTAMIITMFVNVVLNAILVPIYGPVGAAWAGVVSFWILFMVGAWFSRHEAGGLFAFAWLTVRALIAAGVSWAAWRLIGGHMMLPAAVVFGGAVAVMMAFIVGLVTVDDAYRLMRRTKLAPQKVEEIHE